MGSSAVDTNLYRVEADKLGTDDTFTVGGSVGIGTTNPGYKLDVQTAGTGQTTSNRVLNITSNGSTFNTTSGALTNYGAYVYGYSNRSAGANTLTTIGVYAQGDGGINNYGLQAVGGSMGGGSGGYENRAIDISTYGGGSNSSGTINNMGIRIPNSSGSASGGTVNNYGINLTLSNGNSTGTTNYGLFITGNGGTSATKNFALYSDSTAVSYFAGNIGIGTTTPEEKLHVNGNIRIPVGNGISAGVNAGGAALTLFRTNSLSDFWISVPNFNGGGIRFRETAYGASVMRIHSYSGSAGGAVAIGYEDAGTARLAINGNVGIGTTAPSSKLEVSGGDIRVTGGSFIDDGTTLTVPDYVFEEGYNLLSLADLRNYISINKHLPGVPDMYDRAGWASLSLQDRDMKLLEKVEENTLYILDTDERVNALSQKTIEESTISGALTVGFLTVTGDSLFEKTATFIGEVIHKAQVTFQSTVQFMAKVVFNSDVEVRGKITFNKDTAGYAKIKQGQRYVDITFAIAYAQTPIINISINVDGDTLEEQSQMLNNSVKYGVTNKSAGGFRIVIEKDAPSDVVFSWTAVAVNEASTFENSNVVATPVPKSTSAPAATNTPAPTGTVIPTSQPTPTVTVTPSPSPTIEPSPTP